MRAIREMQELAKGGGGSLDRYTILPAVKGARAVRCPKCTRKTCGALFKAGTVRICTSCALAMKSFNGELLRRVR
jgi:hypothetical protein